MKVIVQRSKQAKCIIDGKVVGVIDKGYMLLVGFTHSDTSEQIDKMVKKILNLRIFKDENDKMNLNIKQVNGSILSISQFTLYADIKKGRRPSFTTSASGSVAEPLYNKTLEYVRTIMPCKQGVFGADMKINLINDGPFTIMVDSKEL